MSERWNHSNDYPETLADFEYFDTVEGTDLTLYVSAVGGGTVGREYANNAWHYCVTGGDDDMIIMSGSDLFIPFPTNHANAVQQLSEFVEIGR